MRTWTIAVFGSILLLVVWWEVGAQETSPGGLDAGEEPTEPCWSVVYGSILVETLHLDRDSISPRSFLQIQKDSIASEVILLDTCTGETWKRRRYQDWWAPIRRHPLIPLDGG